MPITPIPRRAAVSLEQVVRPFAQLAPRAYAERVQHGDNDEAATTVGGQEEAELKWSASTNGNTTTLQAMGLSVTWPDDDKNSDEDTEVTRETHTVRVENPDDPSQYVDVEIIDAIVFVDKYGFKRRIVLNNSSS